MSQPSFIDNFSQQFSLEPDRTALLVIDMQNATGNRNMGLGKLLAEQGQSESAQYRFDRIDNLLIPNIQKLIAGFRKAGGKPISRLYHSNGLVVNGIEEVIVILLHIQFIEQEFHGVDGTHLGEDPTENPHFGEGAFVD